MKAFNEKVILRNLAVDPSGGGKNLIAAIETPVAVYETGTTNLADIFDLNEVQIDNPTSTDIKGNVVFKVGNGVYDIVGGTGENETRWDEVEIIDLNTTGLDKTYATVADMKADASLQANSSKLINTVDYYSTQRGGGASYLIKTVAQAAADGDVIDGYGNHAIDGGLYVAILQKGIIINTLQWGAVDGDDNSEVLKAISDSISSYTVIDLGSIEHVISASGTPASPFGHRIFDLDSKDGVQFIGGRARVTVINHDVAANGGLSFIWAKASGGLRVKGIDFDMSFTGVHTGNTQYPWCSAIIGSDGSNSDEGGVRTQDQLNGNWKIEDSTFKLFHPFGQFAQSGSNYNGDPNNGFKLLPCFVSGPSDAVNHANQCRKITIDNCILKEGGNSYGFWVWSWNDVTMTKCSAESFVGKQSSPTGAFSGRGEPMLRYHQFYCQGLKVIDNYFRAKPSSERLVAGFEGDARFVDYNTNLLGNFGHGVCTITGNTIIGGRGDAANALEDWYIYLIAYGSISVSGNTFGSTTDTTNANKSVGIFWNAESVGGQGNAALSILSNDWNSECDYMDNISISNGGTTPVDRRLKALVIEGNTSLGQFQYFNKMGNTNTAFGVQDCRIQNNNISGEFNTFFDKNSTNSRAIEVSGSEATDVLDVSRNTIRDKYYGIENSNHAGRFVADYNEMIGVTTRWIGQIPIISDRRDNAPSEAAKDGSTYIRTNGVAGNSFYVRQAGVWTLIG